MKLTKLQRDALTLMASRPADRPWVLYRTNAGPSLMRPDYTWTDIPQAQVDRLVAAGQLDPVQADGRDHVAYWKITEAGRALVVPTSGPEPVPARSRRRHGERSPERG